MSTVTETYVARAAGVAAGGPPGAEEAGGFEIKVRFLQGLTQKQKDAFKSAADRWTRVIVGRLPPVQVGGEVIAGVLITAAGEDIDGPGQVLGQAGPTRLRPASAGKAAFLPATGTMAFDTADLAQMEADGTLKDVIAHEMGHVIGIGTIWARKGKLAGAGGNNPTFIGVAAKAEWGTLRGGAAAPVPVEDRGGAGTRDSHWRDETFGNELMTGFVGTGANPLSRLTVASLQDLGYEVDLFAADKYKLPPQESLGEGGLVGRHIGRVEEAFMLGSVPMVLPDDALK